MSTSVSTSRKELKSIWDIPLENLYPLVIDFYKKEKDRIVLDYEQRIRLLAFFKQEKLGPYSSDKDSDTGYFDVVGSHRRKAWISLGNMSNDEARQGLIKLLDAATPRLKDTVLQQWKDRLADEERQREAAVRHSDEQQNGHLPDTAHTPTPPPPSLKPEPVKSVLAPAAMWCTPKAAGYFINQIKTSTGSLPDNILEVGPGEAVTIQVPTSTKASAIFWEFVTEGEDIGFGLRYQRASDKEGGTYPVDQLLPVTRRDCSEDLILGSHQYMTQGTYMLQFDNSHCTTSSKVVYYKVFYQTLTPSQ